MNEATMKLRNMPTKKLFISYLIPSVLGMLLMAINILVDGIFVSNGIGPDALAGINIAVPIFSILLSISLWIGMGGATLYSISIGENNIQKARSIFTQSFILVVCIVGVLIILGLWKQTELAYLFGANEQILPYVSDYLHIILLFGILYVVENVLSIFIRNDGNPNLAMLGLIVTSILNIIFNYLFIFVYKLGVTGVAYATALSTAIGLLVLLSHFLRKESVLKFIRVKFDYSIVSDILKIGSPSFIVESSAAIIVIAYNITFMHFVGENGVTAYAVVNYLHVVFLMLFISIGAALQPIVSFHYGANLMDRLKAFLKLAINTGIVLGLLILIVGWLYGDFIVSLFGVQSEDVSSYLLKGISLYFIGYLFLAYNLIYAEYYQAIRKIKLSTIIIIARSIVIFLPLLWLLPTAFGTDFIWLAFPIAEAITAFALYICNRRLKSLEPQDMVAIREVSTIES
ncbi:MATE family efflux transporter [Lederbergia lenta]|uniref:Multidrug export protein MepA n=1 Tax=Lederbergia lenta TaxID=1467 RepID=A0A2X4Z551_LEDLE|nr:MATE family efflux transporter [Lederbergia lenta]MEC2324587.1 MATE family efflux transporter [Lederbergia lenta]SQI59395.1 MATE efflux family protein [Lederbergia lenta]